MNRAFVLALAACLSRSVLADTIHVPADYPTIQEAIDESQPFDMIIVAPGTYHETINLLNKPIVIRSSDGADATTIDSNGGSGVTCSSGEGPDSVLDGFTITGGGGTRFEGLQSGGGMFNYYSSPTVINCKFSGNGSVNGGGMFNYESNPIVSNCTFSGNYASRGGGMANRHNSNPSVTACTFSVNKAMYLYGQDAVGGGMYNEDSSPNVSNCTFTGNLAPNGAGLSNYSASSPQISDCTFSGNTADGLGGGTYNFFSGPTIINSTFSSNIAKYEGGGVYNDHSNSILSNCTFNGNSARQGAGLTNYYTNSAIVINCTFSNNTARNPSVAASFSGGGMYNDSSNLIVTNCTFSSNIADSYGGGMYNYVSYPTITNSRFNDNIARQSGGGMRNFEGGPTVNNCTFTGNTTQNSDGGGMHNDSSNSTVNNCLFIGNKAVSGTGGGIFNASNANVTNCTFSGNTAAYSAGGMYNGGGIQNVTSCVFWTDIPNEIVIDSALTKIRFSDVRGGFPVGAVNEGGNIYVNPKFIRLPSPGPDGQWDGVDDDYGDLRLQSGSPCINAGDPTYIPNPSVDLDGNPRINGTAVDMGAFEFYGEPQVSGPDLDGDGIPDIRDLDIDDDGIMNGPDECDYTPLEIPIDVHGRPLADLNNDCKVDLRDFAEFQKSMSDP